MRLINPLNKLKEMEAIAISGSENIRKLTAKDAMIKPVFIPTWV